MDLPNYSASTALKREIILSFIIKDSKVFDDILGEYKKEKTEEENILRQWDILITDYRFQSHVKGFVSKATPTGRDYQYATSVTDFRNYLGSKNSGIWIAWLDSYAFNEDVLKKNTNIRDTHYLTCEVKMVPEYNFKDLNL